MKMELIQDQFIKLCNLVSNARCEPCLTKVSISHNRKKFYGKDIFWYEMSHNPPLGFINVPTTKYYEYGGTHEDAVYLLKRNGFCIIDGNEL